MPAPGPPTWKLPRLRINRDGLWLHEEEEITHPGILANLRENLQVDTHGHFLQIGSVRVPVEVEITPFVVVRAEADGDRLILTLNDLTRETLAVETLRFGADGAPYCRVKGGRFEARFDRPSTYQLFERAEYDERGGSGTLIVGGTRHPLLMPPEHPSAASPPDS